MSDREYPPESVHELWVPTLDFTRANAAVHWAFTMRQGVHFLMPPEVAALPGVEDRAAALAAAERERLETAELYYLDAAACKVANEIDVRSQSVAQLVPSASGFLVWEKAPMTIHGGIPIRAATWGVAYDGGTWISWWSDVQAAVNAGLASRAVLAVSGPLQFHQEVHLPPGSWPVQADDPRNPEHGMFRGLFGAWTAIDTGAVEDVELPALPRVRKTARRELGVTVVPPVRSFTPSATGGTVTSPQTIVRRTMEEAMLQDRPYPGELPAELAPWYCYTKDGGHCLVVALDPTEEGYRVSAGGPARIEQALLPVPVKAVLRAGWRIGENGYVYTAVRYDPALGVLTAPEDDEF
ncbi:hypothetical protein ACWDXD_24935 [Streptomyces sp. NPDC003314]